MAKGLGVRLGGREGWREGGWGLGVCKGFKSLHTSDKGKSHGILSQQRGNQVRSQERMLVFGEPVPGRDD